MTTRLQAITGASLLTPDGVVKDHTVLHRAGRIDDVVPTGELAVGAEVTQVDGGLIVPGFVDLQVNGGGGLMLNNAPEVDTLRRMAHAHARIGATSILPTLITDTPEVTRRAIDATVDAIEQGVSGIIGLHLEGPHLSMARKGAHDAALIRPMEPADLATLIETAQRLPVLKVTVAPENVSTDQIRALSEAGILVSLGHTEAGFETCRSAMDAGARCVTHLFNAQSQLGNREPGTVGAALALGGLSAGLIADAIHVHPASMRAAVQAKTAPGKVFLVSDSMATAGSDISSFTLNGRKILRKVNRLTLTDGTLAGAHLELVDAVANLITLADVPRDRAFSMATQYPADLVGLSELGRIAPGARAHFLHVSDDLRLRQVWQDGQPLLP